MKKIVDKKSKLVMNLEIQVKNIYKFCIKKVLAARKSCMHKYSLTINRHALATSVTSDKLDTATNKHVGISYI